MKKKILLLLIGVLLLSGCGSDSTKNMEAASDMVADVTSSYKQAEGAVEAEAPEAAAEEAVADLEVVSDQVQKKLIVTENMDVQTTEFDAFITTVNQKVEKLGGYMENSEMSGAAEYGNRYANLEIRIPADRLDEFVAAVDENGTVVYDSKTTEDVTLQYVDTESHLNALKVEEQTLLSLLEKAEELSDVFDIQARLTEVRYQIESYESQLRVYDNQVNYSTVNLTVNEVSRETAPVKQGFWSEVAAEFSDSLYFVGQAMRGFAIWFIGSIPVFVVLGIFCGIIVWIIKKHHKKKIAKRMMHMNTDIEVEKEE